jgi:hypothetical protein
MSDDYNHVDWIKGLIQYLSIPDLNEDEKKEVLIKANAHFTEQSSKDKADIFLYMLGILVTSFEYERDSSNE